MDNNEDRRRRAVFQTIASLRLDGLEPPPGYLLQLESYIRGELSLAELRHKTDAMYGALSCRPRGFEGDA